MKRYVTMPERKRMRELREQRLPLTAIAEIVGRPWRTVHDHVKDIPAPPGGWSKGGPRRTGPLTHGGRSKHRARLRVKARELAAQTGEPYDDICRRWGCEKKDGKFSASRQPSERSRYPNLGRSRQGVRRSEDQHGV